MCARGRPAAGAGDHGWPSSPEGGPVRPPRDPGQPRESVARWGALGCALEEFDVVFAYPWPGDEAMMLDVMRQYGRPHALMLLYGVTGGVRAFRGGREDRLGT